MRRWLFTYLCLTAMLLVVMTAAPPAFAARTEAECLDLGFDKGTLRCKHCEKLFSVTKSAELQQECYECCTSSEEDTAEANAKYAAARIELRDIFRVLEAPSVNALAVFHRTHKREPYFKHLSFHDKHSVVYPHIVLVDENNKDAVTLRIGGWSPDTLHEFLTKKIKVE